MEDLERIRYVAANYGHLQGLRKLPIGLFVLLLAMAGAFALAWRPQDGTSGYVYMALALAVLLFASAVWLYYRISKYYERRYGFVAHFSGIPVRRQVLYGAIALAVFLSSALGLILMGLTMLFAYWPERRFQAHYVAMAAVVAGYGLLHAVGLFVSLTLAPGLLDAMLGLGYFGRLITLTIVGLYFVVGGVFDHILLVRSMQSVPGERDGAAV